MHISPRYISYFQFFWRYISKMEIYREDISPKWRYNKIYLHFSKIYLHFPEDLYHQDADISRYIFVFQRIYISIFRDISAVLEIYIFLCTKIYFISRKMSFFQKRYISEIQNLKKVILLRQGRYIFAKGKINFFSRRDISSVNFHLLNTSYWLSFHQEVPAITSYSN